MTAERVHDLERLLSRVALVTGMAVLAVVAVTTNRLPPPIWGLGIVIALVTAKLVVLGLGIRAKWAAWPAVALELVALLALSALVLSGQRLDFSETSAFLFIAPVGALLLGSNIVRRRAAFAQDEESEG